MITYMRFRLRRYGRMVRRGRRRLTRYVQFNAFGKWRQFAMIRRFVVVWGLIILATLGGLVLQIRALERQGMILQALPGGSYSEAVVGSVKNINPILPEDSASADATKLIFSGLTRFDTQGNLTSDLAESWSVSPDGKTYTFHLRHGVRWQDGVPFTSQDVLFTITAIQDPDTRSPLASSWQGVKASAPSAYTVVFTLPKAYTPFVNTTTVGILPAHLLENIDPSTMPVTAFNQHPIGTGPFKLTAFDTANGTIALTANSTYFGGKALLQTLTLKLYDTAAAAFSAYTHRQVQGVSQLQPNQVTAAQNLGTMKLYDASVPDEVAVFLQTTMPALKDKVVRAALATATDRQAIIGSQLDGQAIALSGPLLPSRLNLAGVPHQPAYDEGKAQALLDGDGWRLGADGVRHKNGVRLELHMVTESNSVYAGVAQALTSQWAKIGVKLDVQTLDGADLQESYIRPRNYDALLYGINTGADPDVYSYWDASQIKDPGLNLSDYSSPAASAALEAARTIQDPNVRAAKYRSFVQTWVADNPAVMLYTPTYVYGVSDGMYGIKIKKLINPADRFTDVTSWAVRVRSVSATAGAK